MELTPAIYISASGLGLAIITAAVHVGMRLGQVTSRLTAIDKHLERDAVRMNEIEKDLHDVDRRVLVLESAD